MTDKFSIDATVINGKLPDAIRQIIAEKIAGLEGRRLRITIAIARKIRSLKQNKFYWAHVVPAVIDLYEQNGQTIDEEECHEFLKREVMKLRKVITGLDGSPHIITGSTRGLSTVEWENNIEKIRAWAAPFGCAVPFPNEGVL